MLRANFVLHPDRARRVSARLDSAGFLVAKAKGIDIRAVGSGNIGATNAMRVLGKPAGISVLLLDVLKGYAAVALCRRIYNWLSPHNSGLFQYFHDYAS